MTTAPVTSTLHRVGVYGWHAGSGGVFQIRIREPLRVLQNHGLTAFTGPLLSNDLLDQVDTVVASTLHDDANSEAWERLATIDSHRLVLDVDDAMWAPDWSAFANNYTSDRLARLYRNVQLAHVVTVTTEPLAEHLSRYNPNVHVVPNTVPEWVLDHQRPALDYPAVGYQMSGHHQRNWTEPTKRQLARFLGRHPDWHLATFGELTWQWPEQPHRVHAHPWQPEWFDHLRNLSMDIGIGPLRDTAFNRAKSSLRAIEYAALGIVAVLPDLPPYRGWVHNGVTGRLVRSHETLSAVLHQVADDDQHRAQMSANARVMARSAWTTEANIGKWVQAWGSR